MSARIIAGHLAIAIARYEKEAARDGFALPIAVVGLRQFLQELATARPLATREDSPAPDGDSLGMANRILLGKREVAGLVGLSVRSVERLIASGALPAVTVCGRTKVRRADLDAYVAQLSGPRSFRSGVSEKAVDDE